MLKNQEQEAGPTAPVLVAQARVTPEELSQAVAAIEARRQAEAGTIPLGEAVAELHLDVTPDELWAEVQARRARTVTGREQEAREREAEARAARQAPPRQAVTPPRRGRRWPRLIVPAVGVWLLLSSGVASRLLHPQPPSTAAHVARPITLAQVPDGQEVYIDGPTLGQISDGASPARLQADQAQGRNAWTILKRGGHIYLRGYTARANALAPLQGRPLNVYNDDNSGELEGEKTSSITLRVDGVPLQTSGGDGGFSEFTVPDFRPDPLTTLSPWR